jgi:hypothetical protein
METVNITITPRELKLLKHVIDSYLEDAKGGYLPESKPERIEILEDLLNRI